MTREQIEALMAHGEFPEGEVPKELVETHISWVVLCNEKVYKIKKALKLSFLDFSTLEDRKYYVEQELKLNQRLAPDVYLRALPVYLHEGRYRIGGSKGDLVDHVLEMKRLDNSLEMDVLLAQGKVGRTDIDRVLKVLIPFHRNAEVIRGRTNAEAIISDFADIEQIMEFCKSTLGETRAAELSASIIFVRACLTELTDLIEQRDKEGFTRDVHGDLHAGNIFLTEIPILFDCIEFNAHFRQIDLLNELAFFTMELDFAGYADLSEHLMDQYNRAFTVIRNGDEERLYLFYKLYRANVRMKVNAIRVQQTKGPQHRENRKALFEDYFKLYISYLDLLKGM